MTGADREPCEWPLLAFRLLQAVCRRVPSPEMAIRYAPAKWLKQRPTAKHRQRWSRWTRRLAAAGLIERLTELSRDRVTDVRVTEQGWRWAEAFGLLADVNLGTIEEPEFTDSDVDSDLAIDWSVADLCVGR